MNFPNFSMSDEKFNERLNEMKNYFSAYDGENDGNNGEYDNFNPFNKKNFQRGHMFGGVVNREMMDEMNQSEDFTPFKQESKKRKENLVSLSMRVKPHTKKFLKEESKLNPREVLEIYEDCMNNTNNSIENLELEEKELKENLKELEFKLADARKFKNELNRKEE